MKRSRCALTSLAALTLATTMAACGDSGSSAKEPAVVYGARCREHSDVVIAAQLRAKHPYVGQTYEAHDNVDSLISSAEPGTLFSGKFDDNGSGPEKLSMTDAQKQQLWTSYEALVSVANEMYGANSERTSWITGGSFIMVAYGNKPDDTFDTTD